MGELGVAVTELVVLVDDARAVVGEVAVDELALAEDLEQVGAFVGLLHDALDLAVGEHLVAVDVYLVDLDLAVAVDDDVEDHLVLLREVGLLHDLDLGVLEALL